MKPVQSKVSALAVFAVCAVWLQGCVGETQGPNRRPVAIAGPDRVVAVSEATLLDASPSFDPDGDDITYHWNLVAAPEGGTTIIINRNKELAGLTPDVPGVWVIRLVVADGPLPSEPDVIRISAGERSHSTVCEGDVLVVYDWEGQEISREHCQLGCNAMANPNRC